MSKFPHAVAVFAVVLFILSLVVGNAPANSTYVVHSDYGGRVSDYLTKVNQFAKDGTQVVIDGPCYSACTLYIIKSTLQVCFTPRAVLGFHKPFALRTVDGRTQLVTEPDVIEEAGRVWETMIGLHRDTVQEWLRSVRIPDVYAGDPVSDVAVIPHTVLVKEVTRC